MDLGIKHQTCNQCGAMIYPQPSISAKGEKTKIEKHALPKLASSMIDEELMPEKLYDEIQEEVQDTNPNLKRFKGKTYKKVTDIIRAEHKTMRNAKVAEVDAKETEYKKKAKNIIRTETETEVTLETERHLAVLKGDERNGNQTCPVCGFVLVSWCRDYDDL